MDDATQRRLQKIIKLASNEKWSDPGFSENKAQICAELSAIVYLDLQPYELKKASRIHLLASNEFRQIYESSDPSSKLAGIEVANTEGQSEGQFFISRSRYSIVLGTYIKDVVILSIRGTVLRRLWDWKANIDKRKFHVSSCLDFPFYDYTNFEDQFFHRGFFESIVPQFKSIFNEIEKISKSKGNVKPYIVWTGHSLGGGMAAIGNAVSQTYHFGNKNIPGIIMGAYTFGMPRYGGLGAICKFTSPFHIYKKQDLVPTIPTRKMGFSDSSTEYELSENGTLLLAERTDSFGILGHVLKVRSSLKAHSIDGYAESLSKVTGRPRPI